MQVFMKIYFPVISQGPASESTDILPTGFTMSQIWYGKGLLGLVTGYEEQLLEGLLISSRLCLPSALSPMLGRSTAEWFRAPKHLTH